MNLEDLIKELQALIEKYSAEDAEPTEEDAERMNELTAEIERISAEIEASRNTRSARVAAARSAIASGSAHVVDSVSLGSAPIARSSQVRNVTDYSKFERSAWAKSLAQANGVQLIGGTDLTQNERAALNHMMQQRAEYTHLTTNADALVPVDVQNEIISLIDNTAVLFGDIKRTTFPHQFELLRHKAIAKGDAAKTDEGAAPTDDEQNTFETITLTGSEIKKTVKLSRKMAVQSVDGFADYIVSEVAARLAVAANKETHARTVDTTLGMLAANKINAAAAGTLTKADLVKLFALINSFGNAAPKGAIVYANNTTIWNNIAMVEDKTGRSYFVNEKTEDPAVEGIIFGKIVKRDDSMEDGVIKVGYPDLVHGNIFDGIDVTPYVEPGTQKRCFDGYMLFDCGVAVPQAFAQLTIGDA